MEYNPNTKAIYRLARHPQFVARTDENSGDTSVLKWSGDETIKRPGWEPLHGFATPPAIGTPVKIIMNNLGYGVVHSYFWEHGYLGVQVTLCPATRPAWHKKQNPTHDYALVFGNEIVKVEETAPKHVKEWINAHRT